ncbi:MAG: phosphocholine cytidylyltransferase family protein [Deltaproteobacteria bacterium]
MEIRVQGEIKSNERNVGETRITTVCLLAAGTGSRLLPLTKAMPKCLTRVDGKPILERLVGCLRDQGFRRLVVVVGHLEDHIRAFLDDCAGDLIVDYVRNPIYRTTNNMYSLWLAGAAIDSSMVLVESDLIFDSSLVGSLIQPDRIAVSRRLPWMNGTTITMDRGGRVTSFRDGSAEFSNDDEYKTVNMYSFSRATWSRVLKRLGQAVAESRENEYYEVVLREMVADGSLSLDSLIVDSDRWYEVDSINDLPGAERIAKLNAARATLSPPMEIAHIAESA